MTNRIILNDNETSLLHLTLDLMLRGKRRNLFELKSSATPLPLGNKQAVVEAEQDLELHEKLLRTISSEFSPKTFSKVELDVLARVVSYHIDEEIKEIEILNTPLGNSDFIDSCQNRLEIYEGIASKIGKLQ